MITALVDERCSGTLISDQMHNFHLLHHKTGEKTHRSTLKEKPETQKITEIYEFSHTFLENVKTNFSTFKEEVYRKSYPLRLVEQLFSLLPEGIQRFILFLFHFLQLVF